MVDTINAAVSGAGRRQVVRAVGLHGLGLILASMVTGLMLLLLNTLVAAPLSSSRWSRWVLALVSAGWSLRPFGVGLPYPRSHWQVPEKWRFLLPVEITMLGYGLLLGVGFLTDVVFPAYWLLVLISVGYSPSGTVPVAWVLYGLTRFLVTLAWTLDSDGDSFTSRFIAWRSGAAVAHAAILLLVAVWVLVAKGGAS